MRIKAETRAKLYSEGHAIKVCVPHFAKGDQLNTSAIRLLAIRTLIGQ